MNTSYLVQPDILFESGDIKKRIATAIASGAITYAIIKTAAYYIYRTEKKKVKRSTAAKKAADECRKMERLAKKVSKPRVAIFAKHEAGLWEEKSKKYKKQENKKKKK